MTPSVHPLGDVAPPIGAIGHILMAGASGSGKTMLQILLARMKLRDPRYGVQIIDPDGEAATQTFAALANPENKLSWRKVHLLQPASPSETFGLPLLYVGDRTPQLCHEAALRALAVFEQALSFGTGEYGPRLSKLFLLGCFGLALTGRPLTALPDLFTLGASQLRQLVGAAFPFEFLSDEWRALDVLPERNPVRFQEYCESIISRLIPTFGNPRMRRLFGQQHGLDFKSILDGREVVLLDLSGLEHRDAVLVGKAYVSMLFHEALKRPPGRAPHTYVAIDEVFDYMTPDLARGFDRLRKRNIQLCVAVQRFGQLRARGNQDDDVGILNAIITSTLYKFFFGGFDPDDAELAARIMYTGHLDLCEEKPFYRPVAVGQEKTTVANWSRAETHGRQETRAHSRSRAHGSGHGTFSGTSSGNGLGTGASDSYGQVLTPPAHLFGPNAPNASLFPYPLSQSIGESTSENAFEQNSDSRGETYSEFDMVGEAESHGVGVNHATSQSQGASEVFVTKYEWLAVGTFSLPEQLHRAAGLLMNLPKRDVIVKIGGAPPFRTRTVDCPPPFKSTAFERAMLPLFRARCASHSPYIKSCDVVDAELAAPSLLDLPQPEKPEPDWLEPEAFDYPDPPQPTDTPRTKPILRIVRRDGDDPR